MSPDAKSGRKGRIGYDEIELKLGLLMLKKLEDVTDLMRYFLARRGLHFTYIMIHVCGPGFETWLADKKRIPIYFLRSMRSEGFMRSSVRRLT
jgi:hypothetical protein